MRPGRRGDDGYTLVELMLVVAFVLVLAALALPDIEQARNGYQLQTASRMVGAVMSEARTTALNRNRNTWILVTPATGTLQVQTTAGAGTVNIGAPEILPPRVAITAPGGTQQLRFDATGRPFWSVGLLTQHVIQVQHLDSGQVRTVTAATTGRVIVQ